MNTVVLEGHQEMTQHNKTLVVKVRYIAARKHYIDQHAAENETLASLKSPVLAFFGLAEGTVEGGTKTYEFSKDGVIENNLQVTLGSLAQGKHELKLDLVERFEQG